MAKKNIPLVTKPMDITDLPKTIRQIANSLDANYGTFAIRKVMACKQLMIFYRLNVSEWCLAADICRDTWYSTYKIKDFGEKCTSISKTIFGPSAIEIASAMVHKALHGGQDGYGDSASQIAILDQLGVIRKVDPGYQRYSDDELRRIAREALGIVAECATSGTGGQPGVIAKTA